MLESFKRQQECTLPSGSTDLGRGQGGSWWEGEGSVEGGVKVVGGGGKLEVGSES